MSDGEYDDQFYDDNDDASEFSFEDDSDVDLNGEDNGRIGDDSVETTPNEFNLINDGNFTYKQWTLEEFIQREFMDPCVELKKLQLPQCDSQDLLIMLQYYKWQKDDVINEYYDNYSNVQKNCGLVDVKLRNNKLVTRDNFMCMICCEEYDSIETFSLTCNHEYCENCYGEYIKSELVHGRLIRCMDPQCSLVVPHGYVNILFEVNRNGSSNGVSRSNGSNYGYLDNNHSHNHNNGHATIHSSSSNDKIRDPMVKNVLLKSAAKIYIDARKSQFKWCPAPDCDTVIENLDYKITSIYENEEEDDYDEREKEEEEDGDDDNNDNDDDMEVIEPSQKASSPPEKSNKKELNKREDITKISIVSCLKGHQFCYDCQYENHLPCPCWVVKHWIKKCEDDSETAHWIEANTHACPKCNASIEKNGGCNHMSCSTCKYQFCWICLGDWQIHGTQYYKCNQFDPETKETIELNQRQKRQSLQRYLHYYKRFSVHESSMKGDIKTLDMVNDKMRIFMEEQLKNNSTNLSWIDIQFLQDAFKALTNGRKTLKWAYCFIFYLSSTAYADVFEQVQEYLNKVVEDLSKIFEELNEKKNQDRSTELIMRNKQDIINLTNLAIKRQKTLIDCAASGLNQNLFALENR